MAEAPIEEDPVEEPNPFLSDPQLVANIPQMIVYISRNCNVNAETFEGFAASGRTNAERVRFVQALLIEHNLIPQDLKESPKNTPEAMLYRVRATHYLQNNQIKHALYAFNKMFSLSDYSTIESPVNYYYRSTFFADLKRWADSLADVRISILFEDVDDEFYDQLIERRTMCHREMEKEQDISEGSQTPFDYTPKVDRTQRFPRFPNVGNFIKLKSTKKRKRHVQAKRDIHPGEVVALAPPFSHRIMPNCIWKRCQYCLNDNGLRLVQCGLCTQAMYCNDRCLLLAYEKYHKMECPIIDYLHQSLNIEELLIVRMALTAVACFNTIDELRKFMSEMSEMQNDALNPIALLYDEDQRALAQILRLSNSQGVRDGFDVFRRSTLTALVTTLLMTHTKLNKLLKTPEDVDFFMELMMRMAFISDVNARDLRNLKGEVYARGVYPLVSLLNHSCSATVDRFAYKQEMVLVVNRKIEQGQELTTNYGYSMYTTVTYI